MSKEKHNKQAEEKTQVAVSSPQNNTAVSTIQGLALDDLAMDQGSGMQNVAATDLSTPMIILLQANSPQCKRSDGKYVDGAKEGDLYNNVTNEVYSGDEGLTVIPCYFEKVFIEWKPKRGGLVAIHPATTPLREQVQMKEITDESGNKKLVPMLPSGNSLIETNQHYVLIIRDGQAPEGAVIPMSSSQLKSSRMWNTLVKKVQLQDSKGTFFTPASYYTQYHLTTKARSKDQYSWFVWSIEPAGPVPSKALYDAGKALEKAIVGGTIKVKVDNAAEETEASVSEASGGESEIPF